MDKQKIEAITIDVAVARMVNLDAIPIDETPYELLDFLCEIAEEEYENARGKTSEEHLKVLELLWIAYRERFKFALSLKQALEHEVKCPKHSRIKVVDQSGGKPLLSVRSVSLWARRYFRMDNIDWQPVQTSVKKIERWEDCVIKIYSDYRIGLLKGVEGYSKHSFHDIDLMGKRKYKPNKLGKILIWLSLKQPTSTFPKGITRKDISNLRDALRQLTGLTGNPFFPLNEKENYIPRFKIINDERNADERAKREAASYEYDDSLAYGEVRDFDDEDDEGGEIIRNAEDDYR